MKQIVVALWAVSFCWLLLSFNLTAAELRPSHVLVLANADSQRSLDVARYYMAKRKIPERNLIALRLPREEVITWQTYIDTLHNPLINMLISSKWIHAGASNQIDRIGRRLVAIYGHEVDFLVFSMDIPLKISDDPQRMPATRPDSIRQEFWTNRASVDSEISLMTFPESAIVAYMPNPLFNIMEPGTFTQQQVIRVARLDGTNEESVKRLVDNALAGEAKGVRGRAYIDYSQKYPQGDEWLKTTHLVLNKMGFDTTEEFRPELIDWHERFDAPSIYFGWWAWNLGGLMSAADFKFPPGAIIFHIHSFSANTIRSVDQNWVGPLVQRGAAVTVGNVYEPYLQLTHYPHIFMDALNRGQCAGVAAYTSLPILSWQTIFVGDPFYTPFGKDLDSQLAAISTGKMDPLDQYVVMRKMNFLRKDGRLDDACLLGYRYLKITPGLALAYHIAKCEVERGKRNEAIEAIRLMDAIKAYGVNEQGLAYEIARFLTVQGAHRQALQMYSNLLNNSRVPLLIEKMAIVDAIACAQGLGEALIAERWQTRLTQLNTANGK